MYIKNRRVSLIYKICALLIAIFGQLMGIGIFKDQISFKTYLYYTQQSNVLCLIYFALAIIYTIKTIKNTGLSGPSTFAPRFKGAVVMAITVTMLVYWAMLHSFGSPFSFHMLESYITHLFVPVLIILDWILFDKKGTYKPYDPFIWLIIPLVYYVFALIISNTGITYYGGSRFPYPFIDSDVLGTGKVAGNVVMLVIIFLVIGYIVFAIDYFLGKKEAKTSISSN